ncbi:MAG TPA: lipoyl(octanoyl) transferase LipB [Chloroflexota bacterium]
MWRVQDDLSLQQHLLRHASRRLRGFLQIRVDRLIDQAVVAGSAESEGAGTRRLLVSRLGTIEYRHGWELQRALAEMRRHDRITDVLLLLEHPHTYTLGRRGKPENILLTAAQLRRRGIGVHDVDRGGDVTYHGPGQVVGYPILKLPSDRPRFVRYILDLERALLAVVRDMGVPGELKDGLSGVWIGDQKICAIGVKVDAYGVTSHGFALNVNTDLSYFGHIIPCGLADKGVTSLEQQLGRRVSMRRVMDATVHRISETFNLQPDARSVGRTRLEQLVA